MSPHECGRGIGSLKTYHLGRTDERRSHWETDEFLAEWAIVHNRPIIVVVEEDPESMFAHVQVFLYSHYMFASCVDHGSWF